MRVKAENKIFQQIKYLERLHRIKKKILLAEVDILMLDKKAPRARVYEIIEDLEYLLTELNLYVEAREYFEGE